MVRGVSTQDVVTLLDLDSVSLLGSDDLSDVDVWGPRGQIGRFSDEPQSRFRPYVYGASPVRLRPIL